MFSCQFQKFKTFTCFRAFFDLRKFKRHKVWYSSNWVPFMLLNYSSLSYTVLVLSSAVNNLSKRILIFHDFQRPTIKFHDSPGLEMKFLNSIASCGFPGFPWPVRTLFFHQLVFSLFRVLLLYDCQKRRRRQRKKNGPISGNRCFFKPITRADCSLKIPEHTK